MLSSYFGHGNSTHLSLNHDELNELISRFEEFKEKLKNFKQPRVQKFHILNLLRQENRNMEKIVDVALTDLLLIKYNLTNSKQIPVRLCSIFKTMSQGKISRTWYEKTPEIRFGVFFQNMENRFQHFENIIRQIREDVYEVELKMFEETFSFIKCFLLDHVGEDGERKSVFVCSAKVKI